MQVAVIFATTLVTGLLAVGLVGFVAPPVLGPILVAIARLPPPFGGVVWVALLFPLGAIGPTVVWFWVYRIVSRLCGLSGRA